MEVLICQGNIVSRNVKSKCTHIQLPTFAVYSLKIAPLSCSSCVHLYRDGIGNVHVCVYWSHCTVQGWNWQCACACVLSHCTVQGWNWQCTCACVLEPLHCTWVELAMYMCVCTGATALYMGGIGNVHVRVYWSHCTVQGCNWQCTCVCVLEPLHCTGVELAMYMYVCTGATALYRGGIGNVHVLVYWSHCTVQGWNWQCACACVLEPLHCSGMELAMYMFVCTGATALYRGGIGNVHVRVYWSHCIVQGWNWQCTCACVLEPLHFIWQTHCTVSHEIWQHLAVVQLVKKLLCHQKTHHHVHMTSKADMIISISIWIL
jgi:hypothetical protein